MFTHKKVAWESWNARVEELLLFSDSPDEIIVDQITAQTAPEHELIMPFQPKMLHTPLGIFPEESTVSSFIFISTGIILPLASVPSILISPFKLAVIT